MPRMQFLPRTVFEYAQSIGDTFGAISGGEFEYFPCKTIWAYWFWKSLNFRFLEDLHEKNPFPGP
jgi:hypothetical protein